MFVAWNALMASIEIYLPDSVLINVLSFHFYLLITARTLALRIVPVTLITLPIMKPINVCLNVQMEPLQRLKVGRVLLIALMI